MKTGTTTIQQTLTPEAATVLTHSIAEASRRKHGQTTPLHVAATLLSSPSGFLRQACITSHPNSSHPLQCRALELCFSVALERLPTAQNAGAEPPISNALMAALKRAQAHQRRGCPEQQQQPLLAVKVELEQLVISILDDPSVSRVMREASFSSPAVKATIEQSLNSSGKTGNSPPVHLGLRASANRSLYLNPRLQQQNKELQGGKHQREEEVKRVVEILMRSKKRNPVLVGDSEPETVVKEVLRRIESKELGEGVLKNVGLIHLEKKVALDRSLIAEKINEVESLIEGNIVNGSAGIVLNLGDLKWLVEQPLSHGVAGGVMVQQQVISEKGGAAVAEMTKLLGRFGAGRLWLMGTATCETYLRCQVYHPSMENDWDLQALPIAAKAPLLGMFPRFGTNGIVKTSVESCSPSKGSLAALAIPPSHAPENLVPSKMISCCPECMHNFEQELAKLSAYESGKSEFKSEAACSQLPQWLQDAKANGSDAPSRNQTLMKDKEKTLEQKTEELQKKWKETCLRFHPTLPKHNPVKETIFPTPVSLTSFCNLNPVMRQPFQHKLQIKRNLGEVPQLNLNLVTRKPSPQADTSLGNPVRTELILGSTNFTETFPENAQKEETRDLLNCIPNEQQNRFEELQIAKTTLSMLDVDSFKRLLKGLVGKVWWQREAASAVATTVTQCKMGNGKRQSKSEIWLYFTGPDRAGKTKMALALAELVSASNATVISLASQLSSGELNMNLRGKTAVDRIVEAVRRDPFSVIMLDDMDKADMLVRANIKRAMERSRLADSHGREISLGNVIFIVTSGCSPDNARSSSNGRSLDDEKLLSLGSSGLQLRLCICEKNAKRRASWLHGEHRHPKTRKESSPALSFDLNEVADAEDRANASYNSSDLTIDHEVGQSPGNRQSTVATSVCCELLKFVDGAIFFKAMELDPIKRDIADLIRKRFASIIADTVSFEIQDIALEKILAGLWLSETGLEDWVEKALVPDLRRLKLQLPSETGPSPRQSVVVRLEMDDDLDSQSHGDWIPSRIRVLANGL